MKMNKEREQLNPVADVNLNLNHDFIGIDKSIGNDLRDKSSKLISA
jgi:hypothetical protein